MTATQVIQIVNERGMLVAPTLGRQHTEKIGGMVEREIDLLGRDGHARRPMPPRLREALGAQRGDRHLAAGDGRQGRARRGLHALGREYRASSSTSRRIQSLLDPFDFDTAIPEDRAHPDGAGTLDVRRECHRGRSAGARQDAAAAGGGPGRPAQAAMIKGARRRRQDRRA
jgi:hypothetical protein